MPATAESHTEARDKGRCYVQAIGHTEHGYTHHQKEENPITCCGLLSLGDFMLSVALLLDEGSGGAELRHTERRAQSWGAGCRAL